MSYLGAVRAGALAVVLSCVPAMAHAESLKQALSSAYTNSPDLMAALLDIKSSAEDIVAAKANKLPTIGITGSVGGAWSIPEGGDFGTSLNSSLGVGYNQTLFDSGRTDANIEQRRALTELSKYSLRNTEQNVLFAVVQAYYGVIRDSQLVQLRADNMQFFDAQVKSAEDRLELGEGTKIDVSQARTRQAAAVALYQAAIASLQTSQASYERWVGHKPKNLTSDYSFGKALPTSIDAAIASAEERHPALLSARAAIRVAQAGADAAAALFGPTLSLGAGVEATNSWSEASTGGNGSIGGRATLSLTIPIYSGGALGSSVRKANIEQIKSEVGALSARDEIREAVISAWSSLQNSSAQIESAQSAVASGQLVVEGTIQERDVGQKTTLDVLNAQAELTQAREGLIQARASKMIAAFALLSAAGRLSAEDLRLNVEIHSADGYIAKVEDVWQELRAIDE